MKVFLDVEALDRLPRCHRAMELLQEVKELHSRSYHDQGDVDTRPFRRVEKVTVVLRNAKLLPKDRGHCAQDFDGRN